MVRLGLLLIVLGSLGIFVMQNMTPMLTLTILGMQTPALPVALWILGAIAAGVLTAGMTGALLRLGRSRRMSRPPRSRGARMGSRGAGTPWTPPSWTGRSAEPQDAPRPAKPSPSREEDWSNSRASDDWDDWAKAEDRPRTSVRPPVQPPIRDAEFRPLEVETIYPEPQDAPAYGSSYGYDTSFDPAAAYASSPYDQPDHEEESEVWDEWEAEEQTMRSQPPPPPPEPEAPPARDIVEIRRDPQTTQHSGTLYSFSYRQAEEPEEQQPEPEAKPRSVEPPVVVPEDFVAPTAAAVAPASETEPRIRVIIPPYHPTPVAPPVTDDEPMASELDPEDWDDDDDDDVVKDIPTREPKDSGDREVWDDWEEDSDEPDGPSPGGTSPRSPQGNPPLQF